MSKEIFRKLTQKVALVIGGSSKAACLIVQHLLEEGARVIVLSDSLCKWPSIKEESGYRFKDRLMVQLMDLSDPDNSLEFISSIVQQYGPIDLVINLYDIEEDQFLLTELPVNNWEKNLDKSITSHFIRSKAVLHFLKSQRSGAYISISLTRNFSSSNNIFQPASLITSIQNLLTEFLAKEVKKYHVCCCHLFWTKTTDIHGTTKYLDEKGRVIKREVISEIISEAFIADSLVEDKRNDPFGTQVTRERWN